MSQYWIPATFLILDPYSFRLLFFIIFLHQKNKQNIILGGHQGGKTMFFTFLILDPYSFRQLFLLFLGMNPGAYSLENPMSLV